MSVLLTTRGSSDDHYAKMNKSSLDNARALMAWTLRCIIKDRMDFLTEIWFEIFFRLRCWHLDPRVLLPLHDNGGIPLFLAIEIRSAPQRQTVVINFQWWNLLHYTDTEISHMALTDLELHYYMLAVPRENTRYHSTIVAHNKCVTMS